MTADSKSAKMLLCAAAAAIGLAANAAAPVVAGGNWKWGSAWNGGQWHCPAGFQILRLEMK